jgi:signal peptidase I
MFKRLHYSLKKSKHIFFVTAKKFEKGKKSLALAEQQKIGALLEDLQKALLNKDKMQASEAAKLLKEASKNLLKKSLIEKAADLLIALSVALAVAIVVRQMWFEFYEIPTGSMRPTFKEQDRLVVSKNQFGINIPLTPDQFYFDPQEVKRGGIVVFTGEDMDIQDVDTLYFYLFPGKKQYIKRLIGKPGDTLYFYGGKLYGVDSQGNDLYKELNPEGLNSIDHVPFIYFEGRVVTPRIAQNRVCTSTHIYQMNELVAKLSLSPTNKIESELVAQEEPNKESNIKSYEDLWGFKNYAMARILTKKEYLLSVKGNNLENLPPSEYYLELIHSPNLKNASMQRDLMGRMRPTLGVYHSFIALDEAHMKELYDHLYTARFIVDKEGYARRYGYNKGSYSKQHLIKLEGVAPGMYEFYYGKAYRIEFQGVARELPPSHPIYTFTKEKAYNLFNLGIEFDTRFLAEASYPGLYPSRYAFYRDGDLYLLGAPIFKKQESLLIDFVKQEKIKQAHSASYLPFIDMKAPLKEDGTLDVNKVLTYGVKVPKGHYLVLGDNYAMSADSRDFGFVPAQNLRGVPDFIFWPPGSRFGSPNQPPYPLFTTSRVMIWIIGGISFSVYSLWHRRKYQQLMKEKHLV